MYVELITILVRAKDDITRACRRCQSTLYIVFNIAKVGGPHKAATCNLTTLCLNGTLSCVDFMDVIMGDIPIYNLTTLCLNGALPCVDFMDVIMGDIPFKDTDSPTAGC